MTELIAPHPVRCASPIALELFGPIVPKARPRFGRNGHAFTPGGYRTWKLTAIDQLHRQWGDSPILDTPVEVAIILAGRHQRGGDSDNIAGAILDALVQAKILKSDNLIQIPKLSIELQYHTKKAPVATVFLTKIAPHS
jgi:Holliday junction resolvase RusA-like endonuclease